MKKKGGGMARRLERASTPDGAGEGRSRRIFDRSLSKALELVAMRGADVIHVRHLLPGGRAWIGSTGETIARVPMSEFGGQPMIVAEVSATEFILNVPPKARARTHTADGLGRLAIGPHRIALKEGDRSVLLVGPVQIRARIVTLQPPPLKHPLSREAKRWIGLLGVIYVIALIFCVIVAPPRTERLLSGVITRAVSVATNKITPPP